MASVIRAEWKGAKYGAKYAYLFVLAAQSVAVPNGQAAKIEGFIICGEREALQFWCVSSLRISVKSHVEKRIEFALLMLERINCTLFWLDEHVKGVWFWLPFTCFAAGLVRNLPFPKNSFERHVFLQESHPTRNRNQTHQTWTSPSGTNHFGGRKMRKITSVAAVRSAEAAGVVKYLQARPAGKATQWTTQWTCPAHWRPSEEHDVPFWEVRTPLAFSYLGRKQEFGGDRASRFIAVSDMFDFC